MAHISSQGSFLSVPSTQTVGGDLSVTLKRPGAHPTADLPLWVVIRNSTEALSFNRYQRFVDHVLCGKPLDERGAGIEPALDDSPPSGLPQYGGAGQYGGTGVAALRADLESFRRRPAVVSSTDGYQLLKAASEAFVLAKCGVALRRYDFDAADARYLEARTGLQVDLDPFWQRYLVAVNGSAHETLPYLALVRDKLKDLPIKQRLFSAMGEGGAEDCTGLLGEKLFAPCLLELIWCYFMEQSGLIQTINLILRRFQNLRTGSGDPLANMEIAPLRPLSQLLWGFLDDERNRLTVKRRGYEYIHEYGLTLEGRAVRNLKPADSRSKFLEGFHNLLYLCTRFFEVDDKTTVHADGFPLLNALREVHLELAHGAHNQFGDMPATARVEFLMQQWLLARPELREFLPSRVMVPNPEPWMDRVDHMRKLQRWGSVPSLHFRTLALFGERLVLGVRFGSWVQIDDPDNAANWARFFRPEILGYIHAYRAVTGVDLSARLATGKIDATQPSVLMRRQALGVGQ